MRRYWFIVAVIMGLFLRIILIPNPGFEADMSFWKSWGLAPFDRGIVAGLKITNNNYPSAFAYLLRLIVQIYSLFADPHNYQQFWSNTNLLFLAIVKAFPILADFGIAGLIIYLGRNAKKLGFPELKFSLFGLSFSELLAIIYLLSPIGLMDGAWWGQVDSLGVFAFLLALLALLKKKPFLAGLLYTLSLMTKLQNMIYGPLFFLFLWQILGYQGLIKGLAGSALAFFGLNFEFFLAREMGRVIDQLTVNFDYFPYLSLNAFNLWWITTGGHGMQFSDKIAALGLINAQQLGLLLFSSLYLLAILRQFLATSPIVKLLYGYIVNKKKQKTFQQYNNFNNITIEYEHRKQSTLQVFIENLIIVNAAFFLFQTQSHDRYLFPVSVFLLLWGVFFVQQDQTRYAESVKGVTSITSVKRNKIKLFAIFYLFFSLFYAYNLHTALVFNYPQNGLSVLAQLTQPAFTLTTAVVLLLLFAVFLVTVIKSSVPSLVAFVISFFLVNFALLSLNWPLIARKAVSLTRFTPFISEQSYGKLAKNMSVQGSFGYKSWNRLSVQYVFYRLGFGTHSNSRHIFDINKKFSRFTFDYGLDTEAGPQGSSVFEVWGDNKLLWQSGRGRIGRYELPRHAEVEIRGVKYLGLVTTDAGDGITDDHTDWLNPVLQP